MIVLISPIFNRFATIDVMKHYGFLLEHYQSNSQLTNEALFTVMHHVGGDLGAPEALFIPKILSTFSTIWQQVKFDMHYLYTFIYKL